MTAITEDGEELEVQSRHYHPQATNEMNTKMLYGAQVKTAYIRDTSIQPYRTKEDTFEFVLPEGVRNVDLKVNLAYEVANPDMSYNIHQLTRRVSLDH